MSVSSSEAEDELPHSSVVLDLSELAARYALHVPFRFRVVNGFMAENAKDPTIGVDEVYSAHLVKETRVVVIKSDVGEFDIPVNSAAKFGVIHEKKSKGFKIYESVENMLSAKKLPKVVAVMNKYIINSDGLSLNKNEVLIIKEVVSARVKFGRSKSELRVFSMLSHKQLVLPKECDAGFTTDPTSTRLYLTDLLENAPNVLPCSAQFFPSEDSSLLLTLVSNIITIEREEMHRSVIVSLYRDNPTAKKKKEVKFIDIPTRININLSILKTDKSDEIYQRLCKESQDLLNDYNPSRIQACVDASTDDDYMTQSQLLAEIRKEKEKQEIAKSAPQQYQALLAVTKEPSSNYELVHHSSVKKNGIKDANTVAVQPPLPTRSKPPQIKSPQLSLPPRKPGLNSGVPLPAVGSVPLPAVDQVKKALHDQATAMKEDSGVETNSCSKPIVKKKNKPPPPPPAAKPYIYEEMAPILPPPASDVYDSIDPQPSLSVKHHDTPQQNSIAMPSTKIPSMPQKNALKDAKESDVVMMAKQIDEMQETISKLIEEVSDIRSRHSILESELNALKVASSLKSPTARIYSGMSPTDVLEVLESIGLHQYKDAFTREAIDGDLFMILDEDTLANELGVTSKLHRLRILKLCENQK